MSASLYRALLRPLLFTLSPRAAHRLAFASLGLLEHIAPLSALSRALCSVDDARLVQTRMGLRFPTPIGLAGGFDKNATRPRALSSLGFGFLELGTVTARAQDENPAPNMFRLPADRALINRLGFPNEGASVVAARIAAAGGRGAFGVPVGVSIGKSRVVDVEPIEPAIDDYIASFRAVRDVADFVVVNVSSPNTKNLRALQGPAIASALLGAITLENKGDRRVPLLVKIAPDLSDDDLDALLRVVGEIELDGVVATNTTIKRDGLATPGGDVEAMGAGGLSGPPVRARALEVVGRARKALGRERTIIGVGGVEQTSHALDHLRAGANLVQLYTGMIYEGPLVARTLAKGVAAALASADCASIDALHPEAYGTSR